MQLPASEPIIDVRSDTRGGAEAITQMVQELLRVAADVKHDGDAVIYFPETFLTRW